MDERNESYSLGVGMVYCFNLIMGAGLLALPKAFAHTGWILGCAGIGVLAFMSYATVTFIIEVQSIHNALHRHALRKLKRIQMQSVREKGNTDGTDKKFESDINDGDSKINDDLEASALET